MKKYIILLIVIIIGIWVYIVSYPFEKEREDTLMAVRGQMHDIQEAKQAIIKYFSLLHSGDYEEALPYHGSDFENLRIWNPNIKSDQYIELLQAGCEHNGMQCLKVKDILEANKVAENEFLLLVEFENDNGSLFEQGPCCKEPSYDQPVHIFKYYVKKTGDQFMVMTPPIYSP